METGTGSISYETDEQLIDGTVRQLLARYLGQYVICELLIGLRSMTVRDGVLVEVGKEYFTLQDPTSSSMTSCDLYSLKFVTVPQTAPQGASGVRPPAQGTAGHGMPIPAGAAGAPMSGWQAMGPGQGQERMPCQPQPQGCYFRVD